MADQERHTFAWTDLLWLAFLGGLALLDPIFEVHKQETLLAIGLFQIFEHRFLAWNPSRSKYYSVIIKILLATLLVEHTGGITSSYYLIYFLPVVTAAMLFDGTGTLIWTAVTSAVYCSLLIPALRDYELSPGGATELALRNIFFFLAAMVVNRFVSESRRQAQRYRLLAEELAETNRRLEQAQEEARRSERLAALGQLTAGLAHEIRNPLAVIKGSAETLTRRLQSADPVTTEVAGYISSEVNRLNTIVTRFLNFARPLKLERRPTQIPPLLDRALKVAYERWPEAKVEVAQQYSENLPEMSVDPDLCEQAFVNLVLNAYEAMTDTGGRLTVRVGAANSDGRRGVEVGIEDTGPGIPPELHEQVFNPFFTTKKEGVGLGLSLVSKIVDDHRGWIRISSEPGKGACFRLFLPAE
ncbi:MAG: ATP-binding protein [Terriglobia bacterium]|jgi:signal transduction histidine kinase